MSYYFSESLINKVNSVIGTPTPSEEVHSEAACVAKEIIRTIELKDIVVNDNVLSFGPSLSTAYNKKFDAKMLGRVEEEIRQELKFRFGINANVEFCYNGVGYGKKLESGEKKRYYYYTLSISAQV